MKKNHLKYLACPECRGELKIEKTEKDNLLSVEEGTLVCEKCRQAYPIKRSIPRFVDTEHYAKGFGLQWNIHSKTQYDSYSGSDISEKRFFEESRWDRNLSGQYILEVGGGSGRFTEQAASTGGLVVSMDLSLAVEANYSSNGSKENVLIVQADIYKMPFRDCFFDKIFCFGVMQHTPDAKNAFRSLCSFLKKDGNVVVDVYAKYPGLLGVVK